MGALGCIDSWRSSPIGFARSQPDSRDQGTRAIAAEVVLAQAEEAGARRPIQRRVQHRRANLWDSTVLRQCFLAMNTLQLERIDELGPPLIGARLFGFVQHFAGTDPKWRLDVCIHNQTAVTLGHSTQTLAGTGATQTMEMYGEEWAARYEEYANASIAGREGLFRLAAAGLAGLPANARVLVVGCGTGSEILALASRHPEWRFEAVEPANQMLEVCRRRMHENDLGHRVTFHRQGVQGLTIEPCDGATAILVSQHLIDDAAAEAFFAEIASRVVNRGALFSADISLPNQADTDQTLLRIWQEQAVGSGLPYEAPASLVSRFGHDLVARSPARIEQLLISAGFTFPQQVFQSTIYRAWVSGRTS